MTKDDSFVRNKKAIETIKRNIAGWKLAAANGDLVARHVLEMLCQTLTEMTVDLVEGGYGPPEPPKGWPL